MLMVMKPLRKLGLVVMAVMAVGSLGGSSALATTITPANTVVTFTSTHVRLTIAGSSGGIIDCADSVITATTPAATAVTWAAMRATLTYDGCLAGLTFPSTITMSEGCRTLSRTPTLDMMYLHATAPQSTAKLTFPVGCGLDVVTPAFSCTLTVRGPQTVGNATTGTGSIAFTNGSPAIMDFTTAVLPDVTALPGGFFCATTTQSADSLVGSYSATSAFHVTS
jgi:hypothetical protein